MLGGAGFLPSTVVSPKDLVARDPFQMAELHGGNKWG